VTAPAGPPVQPDVGSRLAQSRVDVAAAESAVMLCGATRYPGKPDFVTGACGHPMTGQDWIEGWRACSGCDQALFSTAELGAPARRGTPPGLQP
jgi:hypothetical protein